MISCNGMSRTSEEMAVHVPGPTPQSNGEEGKQDASDGLNSPFSTHGTKNAHSNPAKQSNPPFVGWRGKQSPGIKTE